MAILSDLRQLNAILGALGTFIMVAGDRCVFLAISGRDNFALGKQNRN